MLWALSIQLALCGIPKSNLGRVRHGKSFLSVDDGINRRTPNGRGDLFCFMHSTLEAIIGNEDDIVCVQCYIFAFPARNFSQLKSAGRILISVAMEQEGAVH